VHWLDNKAFDFIDARCNHDAVFKVKVKTTFTYGFHLKLIMTCELVRPKETPDREYCHWVLEFSYHIHLKILISLLNKRILLHWMRIHTWHFQLTIADQKINPCAWNLRAISCSYGSMNLNSSFKVFRLDVCTVRLAQFIIQTNKCTTCIYIYIYIYIYKHYFVYPKHSYMFRYICMICRESYPSALLKL